MLFYFSSYSIRMGSTDANIGALTRKIKSFDIPYFANLSPYFSIIVKSLSYTDISENNCDFSDCEIGMHSCSVNSMCMPDFNDGHTCHCLSGFSGPNCENINECLDPEICGENSFCVDLKGGYDCKCDPGFVKVDGECKARNQCQVLNFCQKNSRCVENESGEADCICNQGRVRKENANFLF